MGIRPAIRLIPVRVEDLEPGMFVAELDRSWLQTPFDTPGLLLQNEEQVGEVRRLCRYVYVDPSRSDAGVHFRRPRRSPPAAMARLLPHGPGTLAASHALLDVGLAAIANGVREARRHGRLPLQPLLDLAESIRQHTEADPDPLLWLIRQETTGSYLHRRALGTAVTLAAFGRQLGLDRDAARDIIAGGLLLDMGKIVVPVPILAKPLALNTIEQSYVRRHVERSLELVSGHGEAPARALEMIAGHHERLDGSGYPRGISGTAIPLFARMAAIADVYDALTLNRRYAAALSPHAAVVQVDALSGEKFDDALVGEFLDALGLFPTGTLVELMDGHFGIVCAQRSGKPATPRVLVAFDPDRRPLPAARVVDTDYDTAIVQALHPDALPLDAVSLHTEESRLIAAKAAPTPG